MHLPCLSCPQNVYTHGDLPKGYTERPCLDTQSQTKDPPVSAVAPCAEWLGTCMGLHVGYPKSCSKEPFPASHVSDLPPA